MEGKAGVFLVFFLSLVCFITVLWNLVHLYGTSYKNLKLLVCSAKGKEKIERI